jgi:uncharacterized protein (DUF302 family)
MQWGQDSSLYELEFMVRQLVSDSLRTISPISPDDHRTLRGQENAVNVIERTISRPTVIHVSVGTGLRYDRLIEAFERSVGHWNPASGEALWKETAAWPKVEAAVAEAGEPFGLMVMAKIDQGRLTSLSGKVKHCSLYLVGNPVIANRIIDIDARGSFHVPFRVALHGGNTGEGIISYDLPSSFLATLDRPELTTIGKSLDEKMDQVISNLAIAADGR